MVGQVHLNLLATPQNFPAESNEWHAIARQLQQQLSSEDELAVSVPPQAAAPEDAKGEPITTGALIIALASAPAVIKLVHGINTWIANLGNRQVKIEIETKDAKITIGSKGFSESDINRLVNSVTDAVGKKA